MSLEMYILGMIGTFLLSLYGTWVSMQVSKTMTVSLGLITGVVCSIFWPIGILVIGWAIYDDRKALKELV